MYDDGARLLRPHAYDKPDASILAETLSIPTFSMLHAPQLEIMEQNRLMRSHAMRLGKGQR